MPPLDQPPQLPLDRDRERRIIDEAVAAARSGQGRAVLVEGPAGIGKTTVLRMLRETTAGFEHATARAATLERELSHGVAAQLLEPAVARADDEHRQRLLAGAARLAAPVVLPEAQQDSADADRRAPVVRGLYWLTANLAAESPLLLAVDDVQWADPASLRYLDYLARRLDGLPVLLVMALRTGEPLAEELAELLDVPDLVRIRPGPLTAPGVATLVRAQLGQEPSPAFVQACLTATEGTPYLVRELLTSLSHARVTPDDAGATSVAKVTSRTIGHATLLRLSRLSSAATQVAQAVSVLGRQATAALVGAVTGMTAEDVLLQADILAAAGILETRTPLRFVHPIVDGSVYAEIPDGRRSTLHARAAGLLAAHNDIEEAALHLLRTEAGSCGTDLLRAAAAQALTRGAPESAVEYLRRHLTDQLPRGERAAVLYDLGRAESMLRDERASESLGLAVELTDDRAARGPVWVELVQSLMFGGAWDTALRTVDRALVDVAGVPGADGRATTEAWGLLQVFRAGMISNEPRLVQVYEAEREALGELAAGDGRSARLMAALLSSSAVCRLEDPAVVAALARHGLGDGALMAGPDADAWGPQAAAALAYLDLTEDARSATAQMIAAAQRRGSVYGFVRGLALRTLLAGRDGDLRAVEADLRAAFDAATRHGLAFSLPALVIWSVDALVERPELADIAAAAAAIPIDDGLRGSFSGAWLLEARGRLHAAAGRTAAAIADLRSSGSVMDRLHTRNPAVSGWRSALAPLLAGADPAAALALVEAELADARRSESARSIGVSLRTLAAVGAQDPVQVLQESARLLTGAPLELARTRLALGRRLRQDGRRGLAEAELRAALDLAHRCGAERLAASTTAELHLVGARPRRRAVTGVDALTPSEVRVATQAAAGLSNREIAQALFVTAKTVENQLSRVYLKLGISGREQLAVALGVAPAAEPAKFGG